MTKVTRVNMIEFNSEAEMKEQQSWFQANGPSLFPECILLTSVQTGPTSVMSISVYPDQETADQAMVARKTVATLVQIWSTIDWLATALLLNFSANGDIKLWPTIEYFYNDPSRLLVPARSTYFQLPQK